VNETRLTASEWALMMRAPLRDKSYQLTGLGPAVTDFLAWKRLDGAAERTLDTYERDLSRACALFPEKTLETVTSEDLLHVVTVFPPRSQKRARAALASFFRWALLWGRIDRNPMDRIPRPLQQPSRYVEVFTEAEVAALAGLPELRDRALMVVLLDAGLRKGEARHLRAGRCLLEQRQLVVVGGKGGKDRVIPMTDRLTGALADLFLTEGIEREDFIWYSGGQSARLSGRFALAADRRRDVPPLVGANAQRGRRPLPQSPRRPTHLCYPLASPRRSHGNPLEGDGACLDRYDGRSVRPS
jgi:integrase